MKGVKKAEEKEKGNRTGWRKRSKEKRSWKEKKKKRLARKQKRRSVSLAKGKEALLVVNHKMTYRLPDISPWTRSWFIRNIQQWLHCEVEPPRRSRKVVPSANDEIDINRCCVYFGIHADDVGTGWEWLQCKCTRWMHEDCMDNDDFVVESGKFAHCVERMFIHWHFVLI